MKRGMLFTVMSIFAFSIGLFAQEFSIAIDAQKDAWYNQLTGQADGLVYLSSASFLSDVGTSPADDADCSGKAWFAYDNDYLYGYMEVKDDVVAATNAERYLNDCMELKFDPDPFSGTGAKTSNCRLTAKGADNAEVATGVDNLNGSKHLVDQANTPWEFFEEDYARRITADGYALEFRIPFLSINEPEDNRFMVERLVGGVFGMAINIGDNDAATRESALQWSAGHHNDAHSNAALLGSVTFLADHKVKLEAVSPRDPSIVNANADAWYTIPNDAVISGGSALAKSFNLLSNYPNPFNPETHIQYRIERAEKSTLAVYSITGELIRHLTVNQFHAAGTYEVTWDGRNDLGQIVGSGVYFCKLTTPSVVSSQKMVLMK